MRFAIWACAAGLAALAFHSAGLAQEPPKPAKGGLDNKPAAASDTTDEQLFLLYLVEDWYRDTFPLGNKLRARGMNLPRFVRTRLVVVDRVLANLKSKKLYPEMRAFIEDYRRHVTSLEPLNASIAAEEAEYNRGIAAIYGAVEQKMAVRQAQATVDSVRTGFEFASKGEDEDSALRLGIGSFLISAVANNQKLIAERSVLLGRANEDAEKYRTEKYPALQSRIRQLIDDFESKSSGGTAANFDKVKVHAKTLAGTAAETAFDPGREVAKIPAADRPRDPMRLKRICDSTEPPDPSNSDAVASAHQAAKDCLIGIRWVPSIDGDRYQFLKAEIALSAGVLANRAAAADAGQAGFIKSPGNLSKSPAKTATAAWITYSKFDPNPELNRREFVLHQRIQAHAYAQEVTVAYNLANQAMIAMRGANAIPLNNPNTWFDMARVFAIRKDPTFTARPKPDVVNALICLRCARLLGAEGIATAQSNPDFEPLFKNAPAVQKEFDAILTLPALPTRSRFR